MATKPLKTLTFEGLDDIYTVPQIDASLSTTGKAADAKATGDSLAEKASASGMVDMAKSLVGGKYTSEKQPYHFRKSPSAGAKDEVIVGGSLGWNQLCNGSSVTVQSGHKYFMNKGGTKSIGASDGTALTGLTSGTDTVIDLTTTFGTTIADYIYSLETATAGAGVAFVKRYIDLDTYHEYDAGSIQSVEGLESHVMVGWNQWDEEWEVGWINTGTGANQNANDAIRSKNYIPVIGGKSYHISTAFTASNQRPYLHWYDADKNWIWYTYSSAGEHSVTVTLPDNARYLRFSVANLSTPVTYNHDICINISDPSKNGPYEPYEKHSYPLDSSLTLRGVPKLVTDHIEFDGDKYYADGSVARMYGERAYQSGDESLANAITDGTTTVYKLATPTTETAQPFQSPMIVGATEEYVSDSVVPVGHESRYYEDITGKVNNLPSDFSTLIAPVEVAFKATRNYTVGSYLILNNTLYKVTANIANGGTITPNTNVTATTIMAEIMAL